MNKKTVTLVALDVAVATYAAKTLYAYVSSRVHTPIALAKNEGFDKGWTAGWEQSREWAFSDLRPFVDIERYEKMFGPYSANTPTQ